MEQARIDELTKKLEELQIMAQQMIRDADEEITDVRCNYPWADEDKKSYLARDIRKDINKVRRLTTLRVASMEIDRLAQTQINALTYVNFS